MPFSGGDIIEITYNHATLGSGTLFCKSAEDATLSKGGVRNVDDDNNITGNRQLILVKNIMQGFFQSPPIAWDMTDQEEDEKLNKLAESLILANWTISIINGVSYGAKGTVVGDIIGNTNTGLIESIKLAFEGEVKKLS